MFHVLSHFFIERIYNRQMCRYTCECPPIGWFCRCKILGLTNVDPRDLAEIWCLLSCDIGKAGDRNRITHPFLAAGQGRWHAPNHYRGQLRAARGETRVAAARSPGSTVCCRRILARWFSRGNKYTMLNLFHYIYYDIYFDSACTEVVTLKKGKSMGAIMLPCVKSFYCYPNFKTRVNIIICNSCL